MDIFLALVHHPVLSKRGAVSTTAVTNLDVHDFARTSRTYDCAGTFIVTPIDEQLNLVRRIIDHWHPAHAGGQSTNPSRSEAFSRVDTARSIEDTIAEITRRTGSKPRVIGTSARPEHITERHDALSYDAARARFAEPGGAALILFGTGWGLTKDALALADAMLPPIDAVPSRAGYNHLPVRAACAIILDRVCGAR